MKKLTVKEFQEKLNNIYPNEKLEALDWGGDKVNTHVKCLICGTVYTKKGGYFLDKRKKSICKICFPTQPNQLKENYELEKIVDMTPEELFWGMEKLNNNLIDSIF